MRSPSSSDPTLGEHSAAGLVSERYKEEFAAHVLPSPHRFAIVTQEADVLAYAKLSFAEHGFSLNQ